MKKYAEHNRLDFSHFNAYRVFVKAKWRMPGHCINFTDTHVIFVIFSLLVVNLVRIPGGIFGTLIDLG